MNSNDRNNKIEIANKFASAMMSFVDMDLDYFKYLRNRDRFYIGTKQGIMPAPVAAEEKLYESIENIEGTKFKGYIDCIIKIPQKTEGKYKYWILDWKTSSARGWSTDKKRDFLTHAQVVLYKNYWALKNNIKLSDVLCGFVLLKKIKNKDKACQLIRVSSGPKTLEKSNKLVRSMIKSQKSSLVLKNRESCKFCEFYNTENCK